MALGDVFKNHALDAIYGAGYTPPAILYCALFNVTPTSAGGGTEVSGGGYARAALANNATSFPNASGGTKSNGVSVTFPAATGAWSPIVAFAWMDAATSGNIVDFGPTGNLVNVTNKALTSNVATLTVPGHVFTVGQVVTVAGVDAVFNGNVTITAVVAGTSISYAVTHADVTSTASTGTVQLLISPISGQTPQFAAGTLVTTAA